jgi:hypothetical protein
VRDPGSQQSDQFGDPKARGGSDGGYAETATVGGGRPGGGLRRKLRQAGRRVGEGRSPLWLELLFIAWLCWIYDAVNNLSPIRANLAHRNAADFLRVEKFLHLDPEAALDHWLAGHRALASIVSNYYDNAHFVVTFAVLGALWWKRPDVYRPLRNSLVLTNIIAMVVFWLVPTAPPRLLDPGIYQDVVASTHAFGSWHAGTLATAANQLAAMPSLHISWACWSSLALWRILPRRWWTGLVWLYPLVTAVAVMATGNHFLADVVAGAVTLVISTLIADRGQGWWTTRQARRALSLPAVVELADASTPAAGPPPA